MRAWWVVPLLLATACPSATLVYAPRSGGKEAAPLTAPLELHLGRMDDRWVDFEFEGGHLEFELYRLDSRVRQVARNRYAVPIVIRWTIGALDNVESKRPVEGVAILPAAPTPLGIGPDVLLAQLHHIDRTRPYRLELTVIAGFGDPRAEPTPYVYGLPYPAGLTFGVVQGFHGAYSHTGSNAYAIDFDCPEGTPVLAMRPGVVVATNAAARHGGTTSWHRDSKRGNFVLILHEDGTIAHYIHLAQGGVSVKPGQRVERGDPLALSGNTGFSEGPHLHVQVSTAGGDGESFRTFPFRLAIAPGRDVRSRFRVRGTRPGRRARSRATRHRIASRPLPDRR